MKTADLTLALAFIAALGTAACQNSEASQNLPPAAGSAAAPLPKLPVVETSRDTTSADKNAPLRATGTTRPIEQAELGPKMSGVLAAVLVDEGDRVKKGQLLFQQDSASAVLGVRQAEAALSAAKVALSRAQLDYNRTKPLYDQGAVPPATYDQVRIGLEQAKVSVEQAEVAVASAKRHAADTAIVSPLNGVVTEKLKSAGESVTNMPPTTVLVVQDLSRIELRVRLPENALGRVAVGDPITAKFRALGERLDVSVTRINPSIDPRSRTIELIAEIDNADGKYKSGMLVECTFPKSVPETAEAPEAAGAEAVKAGETAKANAEPSKPEPAAAVAKASPSPQAPAKQKDGAETP